MALNFRNRGSSHAGKFTRRSAQSTVNSDQFKNLRLSHKAKKYLRDGLDERGNISGKKFNELVDEAHQKGLLKVDKARKMKDIANSEWRV